MRIVKLSAVAAIAMALSGCLSTPVERAGAGALTGAAISSATGGNVLHVRVDDASDRTPRESVIGLEEVVVEDTARTPESLLDGDQEHSHIDAIKGRVTPL